MPPPSTGKTLTPREKEILRKWIDEGATYSEHWAFQPIGHSEDLIAALPVDDVGKASPVDRFLEAKLRAAGLQFAPEVSRSQFIRRATFDLTGLPPTGDAVELPAGRLPMPEMYSAGKLDTIVADDALPRERVMAYVNGIPTKEGGTHVQGLRDGVVKADYGRALAGAIKGARFEVIERCGHYPHIERPDVFAQKTLAFMRA